MELQLQFLHLLEAIRNPVFDAFFSLITQLGDETGLIIVGLLFYWCFDKKNAHYLFLVGFVGTTVNQFLKLVFHIPRPWVLDPTLSPIEGALEGAGGFSFPSGHTQSSVGLFGTVALLYKKHKPIFFTAVALCVLIPFSRMYLGVHTPQDVLVSVGIALLLLFAVKPLIDRAWQSRKGMLLLLGGATLLSVLQLVFVCVYPQFVTEIVGENTESAYKNACTLLGAQLGLIAIYLFDDCYLHFDTKATPLGQVLKVALGAAIAFAIKAVLKSPLTALFGVGTESAVRYFLLVIFAGGVWPLTFRVFAKIGAKPEK
jgi:undecaprenyl-diphosphatase